MDVLDHLAAVVALRRRGHRLRSHVGPQRGTQQDRAGSLSRDGLHLRHERRLLAAAGHERRSADGPGGCGRRGRRPARRRVALAARRLYAPPMILVGQYDSPFVRRVAISLRVLGFAYEHDTRSVYGDFDAMRTINPLGRIPSLVLEDGEVLIDSG